MVNIFLQNIKNQYKNIYKNNQMTKYTIKIDKNTIVPRFIEGDWDLHLTEDQVKDLIEQYNKPTHKRKYFVPKVGEEYWTIDGATIEDVSYAEDSYDRAIVKQGKCFATEQEVEVELSRRQALVRIWNNYDDKYSWDIDWEDKQNKHEIGYDHKEKCFITSDYTNWYTNYTTELPYFKSAEDRNQFVESNKEDLLTIFNIKK